MNGNQLRLVEVDSQAGGRLPLNSPDVVQAMNDLRHREHERLFSKHEEDTQRAIGKVATEVAPTGDEQEAAFWSQEMNEARLSV